MRAASSARRWTRRRPRRGTLAADGAVIPLELELLKYHKKLRTPSKGLESFAMGTPWSNLPVAPKTLFCGGKDYEVTVKFRNHAGKLGERSTRRASEGAVNLLLSVRRVSTEFAAVSEKLDSYMRDSVPDVRRAPEAGGPGSVRDSRSPSCPTCPSRRCVSSSRPRT